MAKKRKEADNHMVEAIKNISENFKELIKDVSTIEAIKSSTNSAIFSYIRSEEVNNDVNQFKVLMKSIQKILEEQYQNKAKLVYTKCLEAACELMDSMIISKKKKL